MKAMAPLVSVIITTYNRASVLSEAIDSALAQCYPRLEVIVVDDGSADSTPDLLRSYGDQVIAIRQTNSGYAAARNAGLRAARGEYVAWLDSDDVFFPEKTALQVAYLERHQDVVLVSGDFEGFGDPGPHPESVRTYYAAFGRVRGGAEGIYPESELLDPRSVTWIRERTAPAVRVRKGHVAHHLLNGSFVHPPTVMMRRSAAVEAGELDGRFRASAEYPFLFRLARLGAFAFMDHPLIRYRFSADQISGDARSASMVLDVLQILQELPAREPDVVQAARRLHRRRLAACHLDVARVFADIDRGRALRASCQAVRHGLVRPALIKVWLRLLLPSKAVHEIRRLKRRAAGLGGALPPPGALSVWGSLGGWGIS